MYNFEELLEKILLKNGYEITWENIDEAPEEQFAKIRMSGIGASDSSKLLEVNPFPNGTLVDLVNEKVTGSYDESIGKKASVRKGKDIEHIILSKAEMLFVEKIYTKRDDLILTVYKPYNMYGSLDTHLNTNFDGVLFVTTYDADGKSTETLPLEAKVVTKYGRKYYDWTKSEYFQKDGEFFERGKVIEEFEGKGIASIKEYCEQASKHYGIPVYYFTQIQQQIMFLNAPYGYLVVMDDDNWDLHFFKVYAHRIIHNALKNTATTAWAKVEVMRSLKEGNKSETKEVSEDF